MTATKKQSKPPSKRSSRKEKSRTVERNITERHIGTDSPYF